MKRFMFTRSATGDSLQVISRDTVYSLAAGIWLTLIAIGLGFLMRYANAPGDRGNPLIAWPVDSVVTRSKTRPTLLVFAHPKCPCTRATIDELAWVLRDARLMLTVKSCSSTPMARTLIGQRRLAGERPLPLKVPLSSRILSCALLQHLVYEPPVMFSCTAPAVNCFLKGASHEHVGIAVKAWDGPSCSRSFGAIQMKHQGNPIRTRRQTRHASLDAPCIHRKWPPVFCLTASRGDRGSINRIGRARAGKGAFRPVAACDPRADGSQLCVADVGAIRGRNLCGMDHFTANLGGRGRADPPPSLVRIDSWRLDFWIPDLPGNQAFGPNLDASRDRDRPNADGCPVDPLDVRAD